jgi:hypothetical protein
VEEIPLLGGYRGDTILSVLRLVVHPQQSGEITSCAHLLVDFVRHLLDLVPLANIGLDLRFDPGTYLISESGVSLVVVGRVVLLSAVSDEPGRRD